MKKTPKTHTKSGKSASKADSATGQRAASQRHAGGQAGVKAGTHSVWCQHHEIIPAAKLTPHPKNVNVHPLEQVERIADLMFGPADAKGKRSGGNGWRLPITVSSLSGCIIRGHGRAEAAKLAKAPCPVERQAYASEAEEIADLIADKRASESSTWNIELVESGLESIALAGMDVVVTGLDEVSIEELKKGPKAPAAGKKKGKGGPGGTPSIAYNLQFDSDEQQQAWFLWLRKLNVAYPEEQTIAARLICYLKEKGEIDL